MPDNTNRDRAIKLLQSVASGEPDWDLLAPDAIWWVLGRTEYPAHRFLEVVTKQYLQGGRTDIVGVTAEGDRVAVEARSFHPEPDGREYANAYHFMVKFNNGLVTRVHEYLDTAYANEFYGRNMFHQE